MIYRVAILGATLLMGMGITIPANAAGNKSRTVQGTCSKGNIAESDGVQARPANGLMSTKDYLALMKRVRDAHQTLGADGFVWTTQPLHCDSVAVVQMDDYEGHTMATFSNGDPKNPILGFAGGRIGGDGPLFISDTVYLADGKAIPLNRDGSGNGCHFYFTDHGTFTPGWENRLTTIECDFRVKTETGRLIQVSVTFNASQPPTAPEQSRDPATSKPQNLP